jgi:hypothetical protein
LRQYLNGAFLQKFTQEQQSRVIETTSRNSDNLWYGAAGGNDTRDKVFLLSVEEADKYFGNSGDYLNKRRKKSDNGKYVADNGGYFLSDTYDRDRIAEDAGGERDWWWLRSAGGEENRAANVFRDGEVFVFGDYADYVGGVRPALRLKL